MMTDETYDANRIRSLAVDLGDRWTLAEIQLAKDETAWNPLSTKGPIYGPQAVQYVMHPSGITVRLFDKNTCIGARKDNGQQCRKPVQGRETRCPEHPLES